MGGEFPQVFADFVLRQRPFYSLDDFYEGLSGALDMNQQQVTALWPNDFVGIITDYFQLQLEVTIAESQLRIDSVLGRFDRSDPVVISRTITMVPAIVGLLGNIQENVAAIPAGYCEYLESS